MKHPVITIASYTLLEALKNRLFYLVVIGLICVFGLGQFAGELAVTETRQVQGSLSGFVLRMAAVFLVSLFVITSTLREFQDKIVEMIIALPFERRVYYFGKLCGFCLFALILAGLMSLLLLVYADSSRVLIWSISLVCELWIIVAVSLLFLFTLRNITAAFMAVAGFYLLSRSIATIQLLGQSPILEATTFSQKIITGMIDLIAYVLPALHDFTRSEWLIYGVQDYTNLIPVLIQSAVYMLLLSAASLFDLYRKNF